LRNRRVTGITRHSRLRTLSIFYLGLSRNRRVPGLPRRSTERHGVSPCKDLTEFEKPPPNRNHSAWPSKDSVDFLPRPHPLSVPLLRNRRLTGIARHGRLRTLSILYLGFQETAAYPVYRADPQSLRNRRLTGITRHGRLRTLSIFYLGLSRNRRVPGLPRRTTERHRRLGRYV
jgi:hypothetical protein